MKLFKFNGKEYINFNDIIREQLKKYIYQTSFYSETGEIVCSLIVKLNKIKEIDYSKYCNIISVIYADCYTNLYYRLMTANISYEYLPLLKVLSRISCIEEINIYLLEDMIPFSYEFSELNELFKKQQVATLPKREHERMNKINKLHKLDELSYSPVFDIGSLKEFIDDATKNSIEAYTIVDLIYKYLIFLKEIDLEAYNTSISSFLSYLYKWYCYFKDHLYRFGSNNIGIEFLKILENGNMKSAIEVCEEKDLLYDIVDNTVYYCIEKQATYINKDHKREIVTEEIIEKHHEKTKRK